LINLANIIIQRELCKIVYRYSGKNSFFLIYSEEGFLFIEQEKEGF